ncbi:MAG: hemolysin III family protein [Spirochaetia bacterium]|nr:hemolysin III family protein [Spirochaetia bacterium]MBQ3647885.1 hemolysin III family protein [Spirochaetia bacterium]MBQ3712466.1 hemolysin III family protein [Spirochaetia bacterium]MBQ6673258.1 hemolysin III family protein [Spirochaetia bacterium]MBQ6905272.1 hemolysin III family protein [Spirochaetia bacterium]
MNKLEEIFNAITHGVGFLASIVGLVFLCLFSARTGDAAVITGCILFGCSMILLYLFSSLYHSLVFTRAGNVFQIFDHSAIFILIAGTYTPILLNFHSVFGLVTFIIMWSVAALGITLESVFKYRIKKISMILYFLMGWIIVVAWKPLLASVDRGFLWWVFGGGLLYTLGAIFYVFQHIKGFHVIWHLFVLGGTVMHYLGIMFYIAIPRGI